MTSIHIVIYFVIRNANVQYKCTICADSNGNIKCVRPRYRRRYVRQPNSTAAVFLHLYYTRIL